MKYKIAVVGATGNVGREVLNILSERNFPAGEVVALASKRSEGKQMSFGDDKILTVQALEDYNFAGTDIALFSPGSAVSKEYAPKAAAAGCIVIDNTSQFRYDDDIPLVVPEVNADALKNYGNRNIISNPNCSTIQMLTALKPLHEAATITRIVVSTYQSVSGGGKSAMDELYEQTKSLYANQKNEPQNFTRQIAFNVIPHIDVFMEDDSTKEEWKMVQETAKILDPAIKVSATCVRVPVFVSHAESINVEFANPIEPEQAIDILSNAPGVLVTEDREAYITSIEAIGEDAVYVSRIRKDPTVEHGLNMWVVSDNLRKGAALNAVQIAEELIYHYGVKPHAEAA